MSTRKIFSIIISGIAFYLFINMFIPYAGNSWGSSNLWKISTAYSVIMLICLLAIMAVYLLSIFGIIKEKWVSYANYATGFVVIFHMAFFFNYIEMTKAGIWLGFIFSLGLGTCSVLWNFMSDKPFEAKNHAPIKGYDPKTGKPIFEKPKGFDPQTGAPIYEDEK